MNNDLNRMKSESELKLDLDKYRELYDKFDHNPQKQLEITKKIEKCIRQLEMWEKIYKEIE